MFRSKKGNEKDKKTEEKIVTTAKSSVMNKNDHQILHSTSVTTFTQQSITEITSKSSVWTSTSEPSLLPSNFTIGGLTIPSNSRLNTTPLSREIRSIAPTSHVTLDAKPFKTTLPPKSSAPATPINLNYTSPYAATRRYSYNDAKPINSTRKTTQDDTEQLKQKLIITVTKSGRLYDDQRLSKVPVYSTHSKNRGKLLLINNIKFLDEKKMRKGAEIDESNLEQLFKQLGFEIVKYTNLNKSDMESKIRKFRGCNSLKRVDIGAVIIMSHGTGRERSDSTEVVCSDGQLLQATWIINEFDNENCANLCGKPKIFIFQCCRGSNQDIEQDSVACVAPRKLSDMLIAYSTVPGFVSHRDVYQGTWFIQAICKVFMEHAHDTDVESLLKIVDNMLSKLITSRGSKQTTSFENRGFKTCYLHP